MPPFRPAAGCTCGGWTGEDGCPRNDDDDEDLATLSDAFAVDAVVGSSLLRAWNIDRVGPLLPPTDSNLNEGSESASLPGPGAEVLGLPAGPVIDELDRIEALTIKEVDE